MTRGLATVLAFGLFIAACGAESEAEPTGAQPFWALMTFPGIPVEEYASVSDMAAAADLVVLGTIADVALGREWGDPREQGGRAASLLIQVRIAEVLAGSLPSGATDSVTLEHLVPGWSHEALGSVLTDTGVRVTDTGRPGDAETPVAPIPTDVRSVFFLRQFPAGPQGSIVDFGPDAVLVAGVTYQLVNPQGLIVEDGTGARAPLSVANIALDDDGHPYEVELPEQFLAEEVADKTFDEIIDAARR